MKTHKFSELEAKMSPESRAWVDKEVKKALAEMPLQELRNARGLSQKMLAEALHIQKLSPGFPTAMKI
jgi:DNA-binding transcriptional regulator YiaG